MAETTSITNPDGSVSTRVMFPDGYVEYRDADGKLHRTDGPAHIYPNGDETWYLHGQCHRDGGPAVTRNGGSGYQAWKRHGERHRIDGPAEIWSGSATPRWWINGKRRWDIEEAIATTAEPTRTVNADGVVVYRGPDDQIHRLDGPAVVYADGTEEWYLHGQRHRIDGPAWAWPDGTQFWYQHDQLHRLDGPAITHPDGRTEWWTHGVRRHDIENLIAEQDLD